ncbi:GNAT family N-acetyltransferase [Massilia sp. BKSP1R2A-1]|uniref:GNAT family N-acetyltransferase n=1 Tax=Massilia sp. BKSP1R2A-1 TaxID=3422595 RepID=UPI003D334A87
MSNYATPILTTDRLTLRPFTLDDAPDLLAVFSDPAVMHYWSSEPWTSVRDAETMIEQALASYREQSEVRFGIELAATGQLIGALNLHRFFPKNRRCEIGYALGSAHWGKGYASEALATGIDYAFHELRLNRIEADIDPRNTASPPCWNGWAFARKAICRSAGSCTARWPTRSITACCAATGTSASKRSFPPIRPLDR